MSLAIHGEAFAICKGSMMNFFTDVNWECFLPVRIGANVMGGNATDAPGSSDTPGCYCKTDSGLLVGLSVGFWEHSRLVETVKDPLCFPVLGAGMGSGYELSGGTTSSRVTNDGGDTGFQQAHYYTFPVWGLLNLFTDSGCLEQNAFDLAQITEPDRSWTDDAWAFLVNPEAGLFGNMVTQLSCIADSVASTLAYPLDPMYWCAGTWGGMYPAVGTSSQSDPTAKNALLASRMLFKMTREGILRDTATNACSSNGVVVPILVKSHARLQIAKPRRGNNCVPIGQATALWGSAKNPPMGTASNAPDNFVWVVTRARKCCIGYNIDGK